MMALMDRLSDKVDWHKKVFDEEIVAKWRKEALEQSERKLYWQVVEGDAGAKVPMPPRTRIMSEAAFEFVCGPISLEIRVINIRISASRS